MQNQPTVPATKNRGWQGGQTNREMTSDAELIYRVNLCGESILSLF